MSRSYAVFALLLLFLFATPIAAQTETRAGVRAGFAHYEADGFRERFNSSVPLLGADYWMRRGRVALDVAVDAYQVPGADTFTVLSVDGQFFIGPLAIAAGPAMVTSGRTTDITLLPSVSLNFPIGKRQFVAMARYHQADLGYENSSTAIFLLGLRTGPLWQ